MRNSVYSLFRNPFVDLDIEIEVSDKEINDSLYSVYFPEYTHLSHRYSALWALPWDACTVSSWCGLLSVDKDEGEVFLWSHNIEEVDCLDCLQAFAINTLGLLP